MDASKLESPAMAEADAGLTKADNPKETLEQELARFGENFPAIAAQLAKAAKYFRA